MFLRFSRACRRQLLQFASPCVMCCKMCVTVALCLIFHLAFSEGFFIPATLRKQAPQAYAGQQWIPAAPIGNGAAQGGYVTTKDFPAYQQQPQPQQTQQQQTMYSSQVQNVQPTAPKYEPTPFQSLNHPQYAYEGVYPAPLNSYPQSVQLVPCLCPVNKEVIEQQGQQLQQQTSLAGSPTFSPPFAPEPGNNAAAPPPQPNQKKTS